MSLLLEESWRGIKCSIQFRYDVRRERREKSFVCVISNMMVNAKHVCTKSTDDKEESG
jgi:hypothetical protein